MSTKDEPIASPKPGASLRAKRQPLPAPGVKQYTWVAAEGITVGAVAENDPQVFYHSQITKIIVGTALDEPGVMLTKIRKGFPYKVISRLETTLQMPRKEIADILSITGSTLARRKTAGRLEEGESDRVVRVTRLMDAAVEMTQGDVDAAANWMKSPRSALNNETPLQHAKTELGAREVEDLIGRIRHGAFS